MIKHVLYHPKEYGVYLGSFWGLGFWSRLDPVGQEAACVFDSIADAEEHVSSWIKGSVTMDELQVVPVDCSDPRMATREECVAAGLPMWRIHGFVLVHPDKGVWLGNKVWSSDGGSASKPGTAPAFARRRDAIRACFGKEIPAFESGSEVTVWLNKTGYETELIDIMDSDKATCAECVSRGLPGWLE